jgi:hypothetical protein
MYAAGSTKSLIQGSSYSTSVVTNCKVHIIYQFTFEYVPFVILSYRLSWICLRSFNTQKLLLESTTKLPIDFNELDEPSTFQLFLLFLLKRMNIFAVSGLIIFPTAITGSAYLVNIIAFDNSDVPFRALDCFYGGFQQASLVKIISLIPLCFFLTPIVVSLLRKDDRMKLGKEVAALLVTSTLYLVFLLSLAFPDFFIIMIGNSTFSNFVIGALYVPSFFFIQGVFPIILSIDQQRRETFFLRKPFHMPKMAIYLPKPSKSDESEMKLLPPDASLQTKTAYDELDLVLGDPDARKLLLNFLEKEFAVENLLFLEACREFTESKDSQMDRLKKAKGIYQKYISSSAADQVNVSFKIKTELSTALKKLPVISEIELTEFKETLDEDFFTKAREQIFTMLVNDSFSRFRMTPEYAEHLKDRSLLSVSPAGSLPSSRRASKVD